MVSCYVGEIRLFAGSYAPERWHICDGSLLPIQNYQALYAAIGIAWGGNGVTTFGLPDLRGRLPIGTGTGPGLTPRTFTVMGGVEAVQLSDVALMPAHTHPFQAAKIPATDTTPSATSYYAQPSAAPPVDGLYLSATATGTVPIEMDQDAVFSSGENYPHENRMPSLPMTYIIALEGNFPPFI